MKRNPEEWVQVNLAAMSPPDREPLILVGRWNERGVQEELWTGSITGKLYINRWWAKSSAVAAGSVWFEFVPR
jgi:hypothetical protein